MNHVIACDIDLRRCHAWSNQAGRIAYNDTPHSLSAQLVAYNPDVILVEVASPIIYNAQPSVLRNKLRWVIYNSWALGYLWPIYNKILVAPSSKWKHGHEEKALHAMLRIEGDNHDIRECRAMVRMYEMHPADWVKPETYLEKL